MASASHPPAHPALQSADRLILSPQQPPAAVETSIGPPHYPAECTQSDQTRSFNRACAPARGTQTLIRLRPRLAPVPHSSPREQTGQIRVHRSSADSETSCSDNSIFLDFQISGPI